MARLQVKYSPAASCSVRFQSVADATISSAEGDLSSIAMTGTRQFRESMSELGDTSITMYEFLSRAVNVSLANSISGRLT